MEKGPGVRGEDVEVCGRESRRLGEVGGGVGLFCTLLVENRGYGRVVIIVVVAVVKRPAQTGSHDEVNVGA